MKRELQKRIERLQDKKEMKKNMISRNSDQILMNKKVVYTMGKESVEGKHSLECIDILNIKNEKLYKDVFEISEEIKTMNTLMDMITRDEAKNKELGMFRDYLHYYRRMSEEEMKNLTEEGFHILKDYYYKEIEHHELDADYADYMDIVNSYFA